MSARIACKICERSTSYKFRATCRFLSVSSVKFAKNPSFRRPRSPLSFRPKLDFDQSQDVPPDMFEFESQQANDFIYGVYPCLLALKRMSREVHRAFIRKDYYHTDPSRVQNPSKMLRGVRQILDILEQERVPVMLYNRAALSFMAQDKPHQGVVLEVSPRPVITIQEENMEKIVDLLSNQRHVIILDGIRDPMNLGAILRTLCFLMGSNNSVILTRQTSVLSPACSKASSGAVEMLNFYKSLDTPALIGNLKVSHNRVVIGTDEPGSNTASLEQICQYMKEMSSQTANNTSQKSVVVFGFEGSGVSKDVLEKCDHILSITSSETDVENPELSVNSLNVSAAFAIILYRLLQT